MRTNRRNTYIALRQFLIAQPAHKWMKASEILFEIGITPTEVREVCQNYPSSFVSSTDGYKAVSKATRAEIQHCVTTLIGRSEKMLARASALSGHLL